MVNNIWAEYEKEVRRIEREGVSRSDAQGIVDVQFNRKFGFGWELKARRK
jgi:hypothetical protein